MSELLKLAERIEAASGPDRMLDAEIYVAVHQYENWVALNSDGSVADHTPHYTASLDAAMTLVPEGWSVSLFMTSRARNTRCTLAGNGEDIHAGERIEVIAVTPALALCAAALRARSAQP